MRLSIQFPDKRLLQYDCGKLQILDKLLRKLQAGGHRALIFTQMTKVLDILEQFLSIHGHKYLRLDGSTKIEQRQILTDRFNNDTRILAFILSSRSGGLGINLTGADTVIFYDLDWNPAMDKQCQDRCHRIGQTRDVHIYRLVSEHTIEANILRKANQKRMLDDVVIQEGEFTTDYFNKISARDILSEDSKLLDGDAAANAAMDRVLGGPDSSKDVSRVLAQAEDVEDVAAAKVAAREIVQTDAADFDENAVTASGTPAGPGTPRDGLPTPLLEGTPAFDETMGIDEEELNFWGRQIESTDEYMLKFMADQLKDTPVELPKDRIRSKRGKDHRNRSHRIR
jgi:helicase SWR1